MKRLIRLRPSRATVIALVALFAALAGSAVADTLIDGGDVKNNSITGKDIKNFSLLKNDFKKGQLPAGPQGPQGPQGAAGAPGRAGRDGFGQLAYVYGEGAIASGVEQLFDVATCPAGTYVIGGGALATAETPGDMAVNSSLPSEDLSSWLIWVDNLTEPANEDDFRGALAYAICANGNSVSPFPLKRKSRFEKSHR